MNKTSIKVICFDVGGTLRVAQVKTDRNLDNIKKLQKFINEDGIPQDFIQKLSAREKSYRIWSRKTMREMDEADLWTKFMLPNHPTAFVQENAIKLNQLWRESRIKIILPDAVDTLKTLVQRGYILAIISNTTSSVEVPQLLEENGLTDLIACTILSSVHGRRKPHPSLFIDCARKIGVRPEECAYVGDMISRDVVGGRQAGFAEISIINANGYSDDGILHEDEDPDPNPLLTMQPDHRITKLSELLEIYKGPEFTIQPIISMNGNPEKLYDVALSTMWHVDQNIPFNQSFELGRKAGFSRFELNHRVNPDLFQQWDTNKFYISTVHDPCPAIYTSDEFKVNDYLISSLDEKKRIKGLDITKRTVETALKLGSRSVVIHPGMIMCDYGPEVELRKMYENGLKGSIQYEDLKSEMISFRNRVAPGHVDQVLKSLSELIEFTRPTGIEIGLENRYHFYDIPLIDEMQLLLNLCDEDWYGFQYDVGHAQTLEVLGFSSHEEWLKRFGNRIIGVHLHDVKGVTDHQMPGSGDVDYSLIAPYIPATANLTVEVSPKLTQQELSKSLKHLEEFGIVKII
jgi:HAD superfamily hydrolase (TIGR01549 family)